MAGGEGAKDDAAVTPATGSVTDRARRWSSMSEDIRSRSETSAKAIGALGTTALSAVGIAKFGDIFPLPPGHLSVWTILVVMFVPVSFLLMVAAVVWFSIRLWRANEPIMMLADPAQMPRGDLDGPERARVEQVYAAAAALHGKQTLADYEKDAIAFEREAEAHSPGSRQEALLLAKAQRIRANVDEAEQRALVNVVRTRARDSVKNGASIAIYVTFALALVVFAIGVNYLDSERTARVDAAKACADAVDAVRRESPGTRSLVPPICGGKEAVDSSPPAESPASSSATVAGAVADLAARYAACVSAARAGGAHDAARCERIRRLLRDASASAP